MGKCYRKRQDYRGDSVSHIIADRVQETTATTGTGTISLGGAVTGYQTFASQMSAGDTCFYAIGTSGVADWEVGIGTYSSSTLSRDTILASSNAGAVVSLAAGTKNIWLDQAALNSTTQGQIYAYSIKYQNPLAIY